MSARRARALAPLLALAVVLGAAGAAGFERTEEREDCAHRRAERQPFFGDTHVHTTYSFDAWAQGTRNTPRDAYRFARGEAVGVQPYAADGAPRRKVRLARPLDFAMVSDHAEMLGETELCRTPGSPAYGRFACVLLRRLPGLGYMIVNSQWGRDDRGRRLPGVCGDDPEGCARAASRPWQAIQAAAEEFYDRSAACRFTTFVGVEWSGTRGGMIHRNLLFRNARVPELPPNAIDDRNDETRLWERLERECRRRGDGCDVLSIPHNSNLSLGSMFWTDAASGPAGSALTPELAARRAELEPLVEITQHKGDSECRAGGSDEACGFETLPFGDTAGHASRLYRGPVPDGVYVREALLRGLEQRERLGVNPFPLGILGATDTHLGTPGLVAEPGFVGHAAGTVSARLEVPPLADSPWFNPGGLAGVWAEENSRDALFEALRRRETFGTSGPRMLVRVFAGWGLPADLCDAPDFARRGYAAGVPMGGELPPAPAAAGAPVLAIRALRDPDGGGALERVQVVKGWIEDGAHRERVIDVATAAVGEGPDPDSCAPPPGGADRLCTVWRDPDFDARRSAFYYVRVLEAPSCRWSWRACREARVDCDAFPGPRGPLAACCQASFPRTIRERAWSSPIWYAPPPLSSGAARTGR